MLEGSLTIVGYEEDSLQSQSHSKLEDSLNSWSSMGKSQYWGSLTILHFPGEYYLKDLSYTLIKQCKHLF